MTARARAQALLGVDVGGTFTDAVLIKEGQVFTAKAPTTPANQSDGVMTAVALVLERAGCSDRDVVRFAHGMTVGTNALLEERGARVGLVATEGFTDVLELARQARPELYRLCHDRPRSLVPAELRVGVDERMGPTGILRPLDESSLARALDLLEAGGAEAVAISLLHSYRDPTHEQRVATAVAERLPDIPVSASHEVLALFREHERTSTTVIDAYLAPLLGRYLDRLATSASQSGLPAPEIMQSSGGLVPASAAARHPAWTVLSGPAGGAVAAAYLGDLHGDRDVLSFDMGGTSCDVGVVDGGKVRQTAEREIGGRVLQLPMVDVHTVGTGGGSIGWVDAGGALRVGPRSAGAVPGPASYGKGGREATVTDANLVLGYLDAGAVLPGEIALDFDAAERALSELGEQAGLDAVEAAEGMLRVADQDMLRALRLITVERGIDPRRYALVAFGGAGPMHAARIADQLGVRRVLCPRASGVLSALGLVVSEQRRDFARSLLLSGAELDSQRIAAAVSELSRTARAEFPEARLEMSYDLRYRGQAFELAVEDSARPDPARLRERFERAHQERYGYSDEDAELELVNVRVAALAGGARPDLQSAAGAELARGSRPALFGGERLETTVLTGEPAAGEKLDGPALCELPEATVVIPPGWRGDVGPDGTIVLERASNA